MTFKLCFHVTRLSHKQCVTLSSALTAHTFTLQSENSSKNTKATLKGCYALRNYVGTIWTWTVSQYTVTSTNTSYRGTIWTLVVSQYTVTSTNTSYRGTILTWVVSQYTVTSTNTSHRGLSGLWWCHNTLSLARTPVIGGLS